ncbi:hypothetical protein [Legionella drozanskii]|uniref:Uncharacterized protein n=1 Tax=Legionella drozanskii LLAP-1 TaxID=1212489 RepID=A0A0W0SSI2_9GAMM|nr:hypothetical protein [Legionella drozanskii]KTC86169.1 hypothetical protein Ldro_2494 [Legionella drozanskii LLAP-1]
MKKLILIGALVATSSSYALELKGAKILEHHSWFSSPDNKITIIAGHIENTPNIYFSSASTNARADNARGTVNSNIYTNGSHGFSIHNTSGSYQTYTVNIKLCANSTYCFHDQTTVGVSKGGSYSNSSNSYLTCSFSYAGSYTLEATTTISGDTSSNASGRASISVSR